MYVCMHVCISKVFVYSMHMNLCMYAFISRSWNITFIYIALLKYSWVIYILLNTWLSYTLLNYLAYCSTCMWYRKDLSSACRTAATTYFTSLTSLQALLGFTWLYLSSGLLFSLPDVFDHISFLWNYSHISDLAGNTEKASLRPPCWTAAATFLVFRYQTTEVSHILRGL